MSVADATPAALVASAEAVARAMPLHHVEWPEDERPKFTCDAPVGSKCRLTCAEDCGSEEWPCRGWDDNDDPTPDHPMRDSGECHVVLFLDEDDFWDGEHYSGPIKVTWDGDHYDWEPAVTQGEPESEPDAAASDACRWEYYIGSNETTDQWCVTHNRRFDLCTTEQAAHAQQKRSETGRDEHA